MTAAMRALAATGPKLLRIGVVREGRVVEERIIKQRGHVTVGSSEKDMFVLVSKDLPAHFRLFEVVGDDYHLNFLEGMRGRVALPSGESDLNALRGQARRSSSGSYQVPLTDASRGKVTVGETTFLFQFVSPPPVQPRPQLPVAVLRDTGDVDWPTTIIAAFSLLLHFLAIGALYSDWLDPVVDEGLDVAGLIDQVKSLPPPPPVEEQPAEKSESSDQKGEKQEEKPAKAASTGQKGPMSARQAAALSNELERMELATLGALGSEGPATAGVLSGGEVPTGALDEAAASGAGVGFGAELRLGGGGGTIRPGSVGGGLASIGSTGKTAGTESGGTVKVVKGPKASAEVGGAAVSGGAINNASRVVAAMRAAFRGCYQRGLNDNPDAQGSIRLTIKVGPGGEVSGVTTSQSGNLPASVIECVKARARAAQFDPPQGGSAAVQVPVTFVKQQQ
jgi:outer membrane biosynthesis protein TonB